MEHIDVVVVGAGISGIGAAYNENAMSTKDLHNPRRPI